MTDIQFLYLIIIINKVRQKNGEVSRQRELFASKILALIIPINLFSAAFKLESSIPYVNVFVFHDLAYSED